MCKYWAEDVNSHGQGDEAGEGHQGGYAPEHGAAASSSRGIPKRGAFIQYCGSNIGLFSIAFFSYRSSNFAVAKLSLLLALKSDSEE